ncbi:MAG: DNA primase [Chlamydiae bacterium]|nr:DNA primase [Chlamydiota bacterium]
MAILTQACLETLKQKVDLIDLLSSYLELKRSGAYHRALCPFHDEKSPSFIVQPGSNHYHCFGCQAHGDAIAFLMHHQRLNFTEAVESLAERYQVPLEYESAKEVGYDKSRLLDVLARANRYFQKHLFESQEGREALDYLSKRHLDEKFLKTYEIGLAPKNGSIFLGAMLDQKVTRKELEEVGLIHESGAAFFFDRILFPIRDPRGSVIAFSGRLYKEGTRGGKYINSKETYLFKKSYVLFGLNYSRIRLAKGKKVLIVEGQIDALRLISAGLNATVAPLGTALTETHAEKLVQLGIESAYLAFDSDQAGLNAAIKTGNLLQKKGISTSIVLLPENSDPDSIIREKGVSVFRELLETRKDYLSFLLDVSSKRTDLSDPATKSRIVEKIANEVKKWEHPVLVHESLKKLAHLASIPESTLGIEGITTPHIYSPNPSQKGSLVSSEQYLEADLLTWLLQSDLESKKALKVAEKNVKEEHFQDPSCLKIYQLLIKTLTQEKPVDTLSLMIDLSDEKTQTLLSKLLERKIHKEKFEELFLVAIQRLLDRDWMRQRESVKIKIQSGTLSDHEAMEFAKKFDEIQKNRPKAQL